MVNELVSEKDSILPIEEDDFSPDMNPTVLICERTKGSKLEGTFAKKRKDLERNVKHNHHPARQ